MNVNRKSGFSLIESMTSILVLAVLAVGGSTALYQFGKGIRVQGNKRVAIELANKVLENEKAKAFVDIATPSQETGYETVNGFQHEITIGREQYGSNVANQYKHIVVEVTYWGADDVVTLDTTKSYGN